LAVVAMPVRQMAAIQMAMPSVLKALELGVLVSA
jgi:hypothetical protein